MSLEVRTSHASPLAFPLPPARGGDQLEIPLEFGDNRELADALTDAERFRSRSRAWRFLRKPLAGTLLSAYHFFPRLGPRRVRARLFTGQQMSGVLPEYLFEPSLTRIMLSLLRPGMVFADVGAQFGYYSVLAHRLVGAAGRVFAFEPTPRTYAVLHDNVRRMSNVVAEPLAAFSSAGQLTLHDFGATYCGLNSILPHPRLTAEFGSRLEGRPFKVASVRLDDYFGALGISPGFIKIDVENAELDVLRGMEGLLRNARPAISVETGDYSWTGAPQTRESIKFLLNRGYRCLEYADGKLVPHRERSAYAYDNLLFLPLPRQGTSQPPLGALPH
jgi:FkbM family methyltransferase